MRALGVGFKTSVSVCVTRSVSTASFFGTLGTFLDFLAILAGIFPMKGLSSGIG